MNGQTDFEGLWKEALEASEKADHRRLRSILINHSGRKEIICRRLGIVGKTDVERLILQLKARKFYRTTGAVEPRRRKETHNG